MESIYSPIEKAIALNLISKLKGKIVVKANTQKNTLTISVKLVDFDFTCTFDNLEQMFYEGYDSNVVCEKFIKAYKRNIYKCYFKDPNRHSDEKF